MLMLERTLTLVTSDLFQRILLTFVLEPRPMLDHGNLSSKNHHSLNFCPVNKKSLHCRN